MACYAMAVGLAIEDGDANAGRGRVRGRFRALSRWCHRDEGVPGKWGLPLKGCYRRTLSTIALWRQMPTGNNETNENAGMHHRLALDGPPCERCKRPLSSPKARLSGAGMYPVHDPQSSNHIPQEGQSPHWSLPMWALDLEPLAVLPGAQGADGFREARFQEAGSVCGHSA